MARSRFEPPSNEPKSQHDVLLVHTPFTGSVGIGRLLHIEAAGPFTNTRADGHAAELLEALGWGNIRLVHWIGEEFDVPPPKIGAFVLFDELFAAPFWHAKKLAQQLDREIDQEVSKVQAQRPGQELEQ